VTEIIGVGASVVAGGSVVVLSSTEEGVKVTVTGTDTVIDPGRVERTVVEAGSSVLELGTCPGSSI